MRPTISHNLSRRRESFYSEDLVVEFRLLVVSLNAIYLEERDTTSQDLSQTRFFFTD